MEAVDVGLTRPGTSFSFTAPSQNRPESAKSNFNPELYLVQREQTIRIERAVRRERPTYPHVARPICLGHVRLAALCSALQRSGS